ncbi:AI-2E family transporter [Candidatus Uhrbacteria bacterium]|nr:AI-2E family transporter [Candidatus Uhrbacteria bacterium]
MADGKTYIGIKTGTLFQIAAVLLFFWFLYVIRDIIAILFASLILAAVMDPAADWCERKRIPRALGVLAIYAGLLGALVLVVTLLVPPLFDQMREFVASLARLLERLLDQAGSIREFGQKYGILENIESGISAVESGLARAAGGVFSTISGAVSGLVSLIVFLVISFYLVVEEGALKRMARAIAPEQYHVLLSQLLLKIQKKVGSWLRGQIILSLIIGLMAYIGLLILGVNYALVLGLLAGLLEFIPYIGPIVSAIPAVLLAFSVSPLKAMLVIILYFVIQQVENNILVPKVMQKAVGINPVISVIAVLVGARLAGIMGVLFAIPVVTALDALISELFPSKYRGMTNSV